MLGFFLAGVSGGMVGIPFTWKSRIFRLSSETLSEFSSCLHSLHHLCLQRSSIPMGDLTDTSTSGVCLRTGGITICLFSTILAATTQLQISAPVSSILGLPSWIRHWPPTGRTLASWFHFLLCPMELWNISGRLLNSCRYLWALQPSRIPLYIWLQSSNSINNRRVDLHRSKAATSSALHF